MLNGIDIDAGALANVTLKDFDQAQMTVMVDAVSSLYGSGLQIGDLMATVSGVSYLDFGGIRPIGNANINFIGIKGRKQRDAPGTTHRSPITLTRRWTM